MFTSQWKQDEFIYNNFFRNKQEPGFYVDVGAHDGISGSNTFFFESVLDWNGYLIEPLEEVCDRLRVNRTGLVIQACAYNINGTVEFCKNSGYTEMLSGVVKEYDSRHMNRIKREQEVYGGTSTYETYPCVTVQSLLDNINQDKVDYLSVDTEGTELQVLEGIDFDKTQVEVISVENNYPDTFQSINTLLTKHGFNHVKTLGGDEIFKHA